MQLTLFFTSQFFAFYLMKLFDHELQQAVVLYKSFE